MLCGNLIFCVQTVRLSIEYVKFQNGIDYSQFGALGTSELMKESKKVLDVAYEKAIEIVTVFKEKLFLISCELMKMRIYPKSNFLHWWKKKRR